MKKSMTLAALALAFAAGVFAQDAKDYLKELERLAAPGDPHKKLEPLVGAWKNEAGGTVEAKWALGGRFLEVRTDGGAAYAGVCYYGYDNSAARFVAVNLDTWGTHVGLSGGTFDEAGKKWSFALESNDPVLKTKVKARSVITLVDADHYRFETLVDHGDGKEAKTADVTYTRKK